MSAKGIITTISGMAFVCLGIVSLNGIAENMVACWPLAAVVSSGLIALSITTINKSGE